MNEGSVPGDTFDEPSSWWSVHAQVNGIFLSFRIHGWVDVEKATGVSLPETGPARSPDKAERAIARRSIAASEALEAAIAAALPDLPVEAVTRFGPPDTAGPGGLPAAIVAIIFSGTPIGTLAEIAGIADGASDLLQWIRDHDGEVDLVDDGIAVLVAWHLLRNEHPDLTLLFVVPIRAQALDYEGEQLGWLVGFRDDANVYEVPVDLDGSCREPIILPVPDFEARPRRVDP